MESGGRIIEELAAAIGFTLYPSRNMALDGAGWRWMALNQAYRLLSSEVRHVVRGEVHG